MSARATAAARWKRAVPRDETFECVQCKHRFTRHWGGFGREGFFCDVISKCNGRMYEAALRGDPRFAHLREEALRHKSESTGEKR